MKWTDVFDIAIALYESHPEVDPTNVRFTQLRDMVLALTTFDDNPQYGGERILEAIQAAWIEECD